MNTHAYRELYIGLYIGTSALVGYFDFWSSEIADVHAFLVCPRIFSHSELPRDRTLSSKIDPRVTTKRIWNFPDDFQLSVRDFSCLSPKWAEK